MTHYDILGVAEDATADEIKAAFKRAAKEHHPDRHGGDKTKEDHFKRVSMAHEVLSNPDLRRAYDDKLSAERAKEATLSRDEGIRAAAWGGAIGAVGAGIIYMVVRAVRAARRRWEKPLRDMPSSPS